MADNESKLLPLGLVARLFFVPEAWLRQEAEANRIPHLKAGRALLFYPIEVERVLLERARNREPAGDPYISKNKEG